MYTNWSPKRQQKPAAMAETVDPEATTSDSSESNKASLPEGPAMPKAKESIKLEPDSPKEIPVRSPASSPEYDPWATPKPHADNLIDIPKNISQAHGYDARRPDWFDIWDISAKPFVSHSQRQKEQQLCFFVVQRPAWLPFEACIGDRHCTKSHIWQTKINFKSQIWPLLAKAIFWPHLTFLTIPMSMQLLVKSFLLSILYPCK